MPNDRDLPDGSVCIEVWRNRVYPRRGLYRILDGALAFLGCSVPYHAFVIVRGPGVQVHRYEIYEPAEGHPSTQEFDAWWTQFSFGGFLQRRPSANGHPVRDQFDPLWDMSLVFARNFAVDSPRLAPLSPQRLSRYRWRDHYPRWFDNLLGRHINSNSFVRDALAHAGIANRDGSPVDLTDGGRRHHPGIEAPRGFAFEFDGETAVLHDEWHDLHGHPRPRRSGAKDRRPGWRVRHVRP